MSAAFTPTGVGRSGADAPSGHSPKGGAAKASPAKPSVPNAVRRRPAKLTDQEAYYLRSILRQLRNLNHRVCEEWQGVSIQSEALADDIDWLDCFITARCPDCRKSEGRGCSQCWPAEMAA